MLRREVEHRRARPAASCRRASTGLKKIIGGTVMAIATTVEKRDPYTSGHQQRVARAGARDRHARWGSPATGSRGSTIASAIHDIGKISLPAEILSQALAAEQHGDEPDPGPRPGRLRHPEERGFPLAGRDRSCCSTTNG
ncbi:MAG: hypothetical protein MZU95_13420 [Desulfomicrobium escambiense]|nr:hypothetical protein [Desulfomicrobium escambiense]